MKWIKTIISKMRNSKKQKSPIIYSVDACFALNDRWFDCQFADRVEAEQWMQKVISRFEDHNVFPLTIIILSVYNGEGIPQDELETQFFDIVVSEN